MNYRLIINSDLASALEFQAAKKACRKQAEVRAVKILDSLQQTINGVVAKKKSSIWML